MKYKTTYILQKEVSVIVEINDNELNEEFKKLGKITSDSDFTGADDPRWKIEEESYELFNSCDESVEYSDNETIVDRRIDFFSTEP